MNASAIKVYEIFKENLKLGEEKASMVIKYLENSTAEKISNEIKSKVEHLATKEDLLKSESSLREDMLKLENSLKEDLLKSESSLREEILKSESSLREEILKSESSLKDNITQLRADTKNDISTVREDMLKLHASTIKWMFIFWVGAVGVIISAMIAIIKYLVI